MINMFLPVNPIKMTKLMKTNLPELRHTASEQKTEWKKHIFFAIRRTDERIMFFTLGFEKGSNGAKCTMIYLCGEWVVSIRCDRKYLFLHSLTNGKHGIPFARAHFIFHSIYVYAIHSSTNYMFVTRRIYSVPSTLNMLRQADFQDILMFASECAGA